MPASGNVTRGVSAGATDLGWPLSPGRGTLPSVEVSLSRDSVAAGDDVESHDVSFEVDSRRKFSHFLQEIRRRSYLPAIHGGSATWVVRLGRQGPPVGSSQLSGPTPSSSSTGQPRSLRWETPSTSST